jgi:hypothetical protein
MAKHSYRDQWGNEMRIKILRNVGRKDTMPRNSDHPTSLELPAKKDGTMYQEGEVADLKDDDAEKFIRAGMGEPTDDPVGPPPKPVLGAAPIPVRVVEEEPAAARTPQNPPGNKLRRGAGDYEAMTVEELHAEATSRNLEGRSGLDKAGLIKALNRDDAKGK